MATQFSSFSTELADYPAAERVTLLLTQRLKELGKTEGVIHSAYQYVESILLKQALERFLSGKLYGGRVNEAMRQRGYTQWTESDVITQAVLEGILNWSSKELDISLR
jgi:hypothetical protein